MESSQDNGANILETICPEMLICGKYASWTLVFDKPHNFTNLSFL